MSQKQEINKFSEESQKLLADMNHTEVFELCENSAKHQCPDCNALLRNRDHLLQLREKCAVLAESYHIPEDQLRVYFNPWLCHIKKNSSRGPKHGVSERHVKFYKAKQMLKKARQEKTWQPSDIPFQVVRTRRTPKVIGGAQYWRKGSRVFRSRRS